MLKQDWPYLAAFGFTAVGASCALAYLVSGGAQFAFATAVGLGLVGAGQIALLGLNLQQQERNTARLRRTMRDAGELNAEVRTQADFVLSRLAQFEAAAKIQSDAVLGGIADMKSSYRKLQGSLAAATGQPTEAARSPQGFEKETELEDTSRQNSPVNDPQVADVSTPLTDLASFTLEPIIDVQSRRTAHYRLHLSVRVGTEDIGGERLFHHAARVGLRSQLDYVSACEALGLLARLRQRDSDLCILMTVGAETLRDANVIAQILSACEAAGPIAKGLILEMPHAALSGLSEQALEGLAVLARQGMHFALSQASIGGLDLEAMAQLNIRHVGVSANGIGADGPSPTLVGFVQLARLSRIDVIVMDVRHESTMPKLKNIIRLACGPFFAEPRRVKRLNELTQDGAEPAFGIAA